MRRTVQSLFIDPSPKDAFSERVPAPFGSQLQPATTRKAEFVVCDQSIVERYGSPEALVTDGGGVFRAGQARAVYEALGVAKHEIERGRPWQSYIETALNVQRRMADWHFAEAETWPELMAAHDRFVEDYNAQAHLAHEGRDDGRRSPLEVLGFVSGVRHREEELRRDFFSARFVRVLDSMGYATFMRWRVYGEEGLAGEGGGAVARGRKPHRRARGARPLPLRRRPGAGAGGKAEGGRAAQNLRDPVLQRSRAAQALRA